MQSRAVFVVAFSFFQRRRARGEPVGLPIDAAATREFVRHGGFVTARCGAMGHSGRHLHAACAYGGRLLFLHRCDQLLHLATVGVEPMIGRVALVAFALALAPPALARDPIGTAGSFRSVGWAQCSCAVRGMGSKARAIPAPVDATPPGPARTLRLREPERPGETRNRRRSAPKPPPPTASTTRCSSPPNSIAAWPAPGTGHPPPEPRTAPPSAKSSTA